MAVRSPTRGVPSRGGLGATLPSVLRQQLNDRNRAMSPRCVATVRGVWGEDVVSEPPQPLAFSLVLNHGRSHRQAAERDVRVGQQVVKPRRMMRGAGLRGD